MTSRTPVSPRCLGGVRKPRQNVSSSRSPTSSPAPGELSSDVYLGDPGAACQAPLAALIALCVELGDLSELRLPLLAQLLKAHLPVQLLAVHAHGRTMPAGPRAVRRSAALLTDAPAEDYSERAYARRRRIRIERASCWTPRPAVTSGFRSGPDRIRTCDLRFRRPTLYPAELRARRDSPWTGHCRAG
jgi:hypothetical protein